MSDGVEDYVMRNTHQRERGQVLVIAALLLPVLLAMAGMAVDVGNYASERRSLQNAADAMALAGGQELPDTTQAQAAALALADNHGVDPSDVSITFSGGNTAPRIRVVIEREHEFGFMKIVGIESSDVGAAAAANLYSAGGGEGIVPWSITQDTVDAATSGSEVVIKYDASSSSYGQGNFGPIRIDGNGGSDYESSVKYGANSNICSEAMSNCTVSACPGTYPNTCAENSPECDGPECPPKTGNMTGPTRDAVDYRMGNTSTSCDTFEEVFTPVGAFHQLPDELRETWEQHYAGAETSNSSGGRLLHHGSGSHPTYTPTPTPTRTNTPAPTNTPVPTNTSGPTNTPAPTDTPGPATATPTPGSGWGGQEYRLNPNCNPWSGGRCNSNSDSNCSRRVFLIPIVDEFGNGSSDPVTIVGFALVYLEGYDSGKCSGNSCEIKARFVQAQVDTTGFSAAYDPDSTVHFVRLTE